MNKIRKALLGLGALAFSVACATGAMAQQTRVLKMQSVVPASSTVFEQFVMFAKRVDQLSGGRLKVETMPGGQVVPPFEVLDATHKRVLDGAQSWAGYWVGKNKAAILFTGGPGGPFGMDHIDYMGWMWHGGGFDMYQNFYRDTLKLNVVAIPLLTLSPQALGWFKRKIESVADFKGMRCRETGIAQEVFNEMGMRTVNMPGAEIMPAAERGVIDCAEWVGGIEDLRFGFHTVWKYHYAPSLHEVVSIGELLVNGDVWKELIPEHQEILKAASYETLFVHWAKWQRQNAEAVEEFRTVHKVNVLETPPDLHKEFLQAWDRVAAREAERNPLFKEVYESLRKWASISVPTKRLYFPAYSIAADYYWPPK